MRRFSLFPQWLGSLILQFCGYVWNRFQRSRRAAAQGLVEYSLILVLIAVVVIGALTTLGGKVSETFEEINCGVGGGQYRTDNGNGNSNRCIGTRTNGGGGGNGGGNGP